MAFVANTPQRGRGGHDSHPVPHAARMNAHLAQWFWLEGDRPMAPKTTGREIAYELSRNLRPSARRDLFREGDL